MKLYYFPPSTYSQKVLLALYEKGVEFEKHHVNVLDPEQRASYQEIYEIGRIPLLIPEPDHMIPESSIIIEYLDQRFDNGPKLIPDDPELGRKTRFMDRMNDFYLNEATVAVLFDSWKPEQERDPEKVARAQAHLDCSYKHLNNYLAENKWLMGEEFTLADCAAIPAMFYGQQVYPYEAFPHLCRYFEDAKQRPSYQKVLEESLPVLEKMSENR